MYRAILCSFEIGVGLESAEVGLFVWDEIPWDVIVFFIVCWVLVYFCCVEVSVLWVLVINFEGESMWIEDMMFEIDVL